MAQYNPKTLAKTLSFILCHSPGDYGLFWSPDGTMPWKEFYWALQEDPSLRFVREAHLREILFLGIDFPVEVEGNVLKLRPGHAPPELIEVEPPPRLFFGCRTRAYLSTIEHGINATSRPFVALASNRELAQRISRRRDPEAILMEIRADEAHQEGIRFLRAGACLFLTTHIPPGHILAPKLKDDLLLKLATAGKKEKHDAKPSGKDRPMTPGSFLMEAHHLDVQTGQKSADHRKQKGKHGADWKREARRDRGKRSV